MDWIQFIIFIVMLGTLIRLLYKESVERKNAREQDSSDRKEMMQSIKNIEIQVTDLDKVLHPPEKRHFR